MKLSKTLITIAITVLAEIVFVPLLGRFLYKLVSLSLSGQELGMLTLWVIPLVALTALAVIFIILALFIKKFLKDQRLIWVSLVSFILTAVFFFLLGSYFMLSDFKKSSKLYEQTQETAKNTHVTILSFDELPVLDNEGKVSGISFEWKFKSDKSLDMVINPHARFVGRHYKGKADFDLSLGPDEVVMDGKPVPYDFANYYQVGAYKNHEIVFAYKNLSTDGQYMTEEPGYFKIGIQFGVRNPDDVYNNAGLGVITDVVDKTGLSVLTDEYYKSNQFKSKVYRIAGSKN